jgi:hypothetical protein
MVLEISKSKPDLDDLVDRARGRKKYLIFIVHEDLAVA